MLLIDSKKALQYVSSGRFDSEGVWIHPERICDSDEIIFVCGGDVYISEEEKNYELHKNDIFVLEKGKRHLGFKASENVSFFWLHFLFSETNKLPKYLKTDSPLSLVTLFKQLLHFTNTPGYSSFCGDMLCGLILEELIFLNNPASRRIKQLAVSVKEWVRINTEKNISATSVSDKFGYTEDYLNRIFKQAYGISLKQYIINQKLDKAKLLLQTTLYTVKQISAILGYSDENLFLKFFIYHTKTTPTEYRNIYTNIHTNNK